MVAHQGKWPGANGRVAFPARVTPVGSDANGHGFNVADRSGREGPIPNSRFSDFQNKARRGFGKFALVRDKLASATKTAAAISHPGFARFCFKRVQKEPKLAVSASYRLAHQGGKGSESSPSLAFLSEDSLTPTRVL